MEQEELQKKVLELKKENDRLAHELRLKMDNYGLYWFDCPEAFDAESEDRIPVLEEVAEKAIKNADGKPTHILIEGENYHALTCLNFTHRGKIDVIYIDPPYNTGNDDFIYKDKRFLKEYPDGQPIKKDTPLYHSSWLSFMSKRLRLAKSLLNDRGLLFISIDDNEQSNLKLLCDKIFDEKNFVACFSWMRTETASHLSHTVRSKIEYVLCYQGQKLDFILNGGLTDGCDVPLLNATNAVSDIVIPKRSLVVKIKDGHYFGTHDKVEILDDFVVMNGRAQNDLHIRGRFKWKQDTIDDEVSSGTYFIVKTTSFSIRFQRSEKTVETPSNIVTKNECGVGTNEDGNNEILQIFGRKVFNYAKPTSLIQYLINMHENKDATILDFFAGSGTTGHAVMKLNAKDGGNRRYILVTNNENNICENVTYPRVTRVTNGFTSQGKVVDELFREKLTFSKLKKAGDMLDAVKQIREDNKNSYDSTKSVIKDDFLIVTGERKTHENVPGLGGSLKYFRTAFVGNHGCADALDEDRDALAANAGTMLSLAENTLDATPVPKKAEDFWRHYTDGAHRHTLVYQSSDYAGYPSLSAEADRIRAADAEARIVVYAYTIGGDVAQFENEFDGGLDRLELKPIPEPILDIYRSINGD